jgi:hypothetical protein
MKAAFKMFRWLSWVLLVISLPGSTPTCTTRVLGGTPSRVPRPSTGPNELRWDLADKFKPACESTTASSRIVISARGGLANGSVGERTLSISCKLDILDTNDLVALDVIDLGIMRLRDENDKDVQFLRNQYQFVRQYQPVRWDYSGDPIRATLLPCGFTLLIRLDPNQPVPSSLSRVEGYIYALYAEDEIKVDVPFGPQRDWVDAAPGLRIMVTPDTPPPPGPIQFVPRGSSSPSVYASPVAIYEFRTCVQSTTGLPVLGLQDPWPSDSSWTLGDYVVVKTSLYDRVSNLSASVSTPNVTSDPWGRGGAICTGWARQDLHSYDTIRHAIAVHPVEVKIPFVLTNIPVPKFQQ